MIIKPVLSDNSRLDGTRNIRIYVYDSKTRQKTFIKTEYYCRPAEWKNGKVRNRPNADFVNSKVNQQVIELEEKWLKNSGLKPSALRNDSEVSFFGFIDTFLKNAAAGKVLHKGAPFSKNTVANYKTYTDHLRRFMPAADWKDINETFYTDYVHFLRDEGYAENSITKAIKVLKTIMNRGKMFHSNNSFRDFKAAYQDTETVALSEAEIEKIMKVKLPDHLARERDRFYVSYNLLLRFGDSIQIGKENLVKKRGKWLVQVTHEKTKTQATIPLFGRSLQILRSWDFQVPKTTNQESNWKLKEIAQMAGIKDPVTITTTKGNKIKKETLPKYKLITTHTARRSMATNLYLAGFDLKEIQLMGGWKSVAVLEKYLKVDKLQNALKASDHPFFKKK